MTGLDTTHPPALPKWYLAAPFFNPAQLELVQAIELSFADNNVPAFSPRLCGENKKKGPLTSADADSIFARNIDNILDCGCMLAVLDWKMPENQALHVVTREECTPYHKTVSPPLNLPDSGTVFEMGAMYMQWLLLHTMAGSGFRSSGGKPRLVGFTERSDNEKLNIMLSKACCGIIHGLAQLNDFLNKGDLQWDKAKPWAGANL